SPPSPASSLTPDVEGTAEALAIVDVYDNATCSGLALGSGVADAAGAFDVTVSVTDNVVTLLYAAATDAAGNTSPCSTEPLAYLHDDSQPIVPELTGSDPPSPSRTSTTPTLYG